MWVLHGLLHADLQSQPRDWGDGVMGRALVAIGDDLGSSPGTHMAGLLPRDAILSSDL